jgi:hypothetical protein
MRSVQQNRHLPRTNSGSRTICAFQPSHSAILRSETGRSVSLDRLNFSNNRLDWRGRGLYTGELINQLA